MSFNILFDISWHPALFQSISSCVLGQWQFALSRVESGAIDRS
jgi:hypothetical protein